MRGSFGSDAVSEVKSRIDIVAVIGEYVPLRKQGKNYVGLCPFHQEKTPSLNVDSERQMFYCFGCGVGGDVYSFLMRQEQVDFGEALRRLAERAGVELGLAPSEGPEAAAYLGLYKVNEAAQELYSYMLVHHSYGKSARSYLHQRGFDEEEWKRFGLGWAPEQDLVRLQLKKKGFDEEALLAAGLIARRDDGTRYERFRGRVMFPIHDRQGRVVGFGGRTLGNDGRPKYLNSPETLIFHKGKMLYGLKWAQAEARRKGQIVVVEGYMDVLSAHKNGLSFVVASLGTALTAEQARLLRASAQKVVTSFDGDSAGKSATLRGLDILQDAGCQVWVAPLPAGYDPDKLVREQGAQALERLWGEDAIPLIVYKLKQAKSKSRLIYLEEKLAVLREVLPDVAKLKGPIERQEYVRFLAEELALHEEALWEELKKLPNQDKTANSRHNRIAALMPARPWRRKAEEEILALMLQERQVCDQVASILGWDFFTDSRLKSLGLILKQWLEEHANGSPDVAALMEEAACSKEIAALAYELMLEDRAAFASMDDNVRSIQVHRLQEEERELLEKIKVTDDNEGDRLLHRLDQVRRELLELRCSVPARERGEPDERRSPK